MFGFSLRLRVSTGKQTRQPRVLVTLITAYAPCRCTLDHPPLPYTLTLVIGFAPVHLLIFTSSTDSLDNDHLIRLPPFSPTSRCFPQFFCSSPRILFPSLFFFYSTSIPPFPLVFLPSVSVSLPIILSSLFLFSVSSFYFGLYLLPSFIHYHSPLLFLLLPLKHLLSHYLGQNLRQLQSRTQHTYFLRFSC